MEIHSRKNIKVLFVSTFSKELNFGGALCSNRNHQSLIDLFGNENVTSFHLNPEKTVGICKYFFRIKNIFKGYMLALNDARVNEINRIIITEEITHVFLDSSLLGKLSKELSKQHKSIQIISFFHNFELKFLFEAVVRGRKYSRLFWILLGYVNEKMTCKYANSIISLNKCDSDLIKKIYGRTSDFIIPISLITKVKNDNEIELNQSYQKNERINLLFIGSNFYANVHGIQWFLSNVLPKINANLTIIGKDIDKVELKYNEKCKVEILANVKDLSYYYNRSELVIAPIFLGSGMKVKIAEAIMYNKPVLGTSMAFEGYDLENDSLILANNSFEFIRQIVEFDPKILVDKPYKLFLEKYSFNATINQFEKVFY